jgi:YbbR domain-containing protein
MKKFFTTNIWLKLVSLIMAVALWFFVILSGRSEVTMDVPVNFINIPDKFEIVDYPKSISITIEGQERLLKYLKPDEINAVLDISNAKSGRSFYTISRENIKLPKSFLVTGINPETFSLTIEVQLKKVVSVKPHITGAPEKSYKIAAIKVEPETVTLEGPASAISKIDIVRTEPIDINGINNNLVYKANLDLSDPLIKKNINKVDIKLYLEKISKETR